MFFESRNREGQVEKVRESGTVGDSQTDRQGGKGRGREEKGREEREQEQRDGKEEEEGRRESERQRISEFV